MKKLTKTLLMITIVALAACKKEDTVSPTPTNSQPDYSTQAIVSTESSVATALMYDMVVTVDDAMDANLDGVPNARIAASCGTVKLDKASKSVSIDYGTGCESRTGTQKRGKITVKYEGDPKVGAGQTWAVTFENYAIDTYSINGSAAVEYVYKKESNGFQATIKSASLTVSDGQKGLTMSDMSLTALITLGAKLKDNSDNETKVSGSMKGKYSDGKEFTAEITNELVFKGTCTEAKNYIPTQGILKATVSALTTSVDFSTGTGDCNKTVKITYPNGSTETKDL
ncbi:MAG: hypothetical protein U0Y10_14595 [Spirosomataceae bacterium]